MSKRATMKVVIASGGLLLLCAAPQSAVSYSNPAGSAPAAMMKPAPAPGDASSHPPDLLEGLTLADEQKAKISQIRGDTDSRLAVLHADTKLSPEAVDAMRLGYQRLENGRILEVLTPEQQGQVRKRIAAWRSSKGKPQYPMRRPSATDPASPSP